jgi:hypothetical protein
MVEVEPGCVIAEVFVIVKVKVFVWALNSQTTVAVENPPESTPTTVIVSALTVAALSSTKANKDSSTRLGCIWAIENPLF